MDCSTEAGERLFADYPGRTVDHGIVCFRKSSYCAALNLSNIYGFFFMNRRCWGIQ